VVKCAVLTTVLVVVSLRADSFVATDDDDYVGADTCAGCHEEKFKHFSTTPHVALIGDEHLPVRDRGCEACHGPGAAHVGSAGKPGTILNPRKGTAAEVAARCARCHQEQMPGRQTFHYEHDTDAVSCNDCHSPHQPQTNRALLMTPQPALCLGCHGETAAQFRRPYHHRVLEGAMACTDCHQPHERWNTAESRRSVEGVSTLCARCHADKRGPFVFEHLAITRSRDACMTCHSPHGSTNNRLLVRNTVFQVCIQCHAEIGLSASGSAGVFPHDLANPRTRECIVCHTQIHGSNTSRVFLN
jgi:DmsE family decaheme c-type cytochrome